MAPWRQRTRCKAPTNQRPCSHRPWGVRGAVPLNPNFAERSPQPVASPTEQAQVLTLPESERMLTSHMRPCYTCGTQPVLDNDRYGLRYRCPRCGKLSGLPWADHQTVIEDWDSLNDPATMPVVQLAGERA